METAMTQINGVDIEQLAGTFKAIKDNPEMARYTFRAVNTWVGGTRSFTEIKEFSPIGREGDIQSEAFILDGNEPPVTLGKHAAPNAVAYILHALASSLTVGITYTASSWGIVCNSLQIELEGKLDLNGFLGLSNSVRPGFQEIDVTAVISCSGKTENYLESLKALSEHVQRTSPILDMLRNPVKVNIELLESTDVK